MINATEFMKFQTEAFKATNALAAKSFEGMQKLADLNMQMTKTTLEQSAEQVKTLLAAKDAKALTELLAGYAKPNEQFTAYAKDAYDIVVEANGEVSELIEQQVEQGSQQVFQAIDDLAKNAPAGSESAISFMKQYLTATRGAYEQASKAGKQLTQMAETNLANANGAAKSKAKK